MTVRVIDHTGSIVAEGTLYNVRMNRLAACGSREVIRTADRTHSKAPLTFGHCSVIFDAPVAVPLWYGGSYVTNALDFSLPSGLHNVWGCGSDFDTDSSNIHPEDLIEIVRNLA